MCCLTTLTNLTGFFRRVEALVPAQPVLETKDFPRATTFGDFGGRGAEPVHSGQAEHGELQEYGRFHPEDGCDLVWFLLVAPFRF